MRSHSLVILCDICGRMIADEAAKELIFQVNRLRYRFEICSSCLVTEMGRLGHARWIPGFRKRAALSFVLDSTDALPRRAAV